ncbi:conjugal transfer protein TraF [Salmonella enterica]|nr:conjugal transfer protein TraF [Salmonella enterica]ECY7269033.1 conjugal transfer protein TraF [Salmonella enterica]
MPLKLVLIVVGFMTLSACSVNPPQPTKPKGKWVQMNTHVPAAQAQLKKIQAEQERGK